MEHGWVWQGIEECGRIWKRLSFRSGWWMTEVGEKEEFLNQHRAEREIIWRNVVDMNIFDKFPRNFKTAR